jgi:hypothetical protein
MKEDNLKKVSTLNYIDSWAKQVRMQAMDMKNLFNSNFGTRWSNYSLDVWEVEDGIDDIIDSADQITDSVEEMEL